MKINNLNTMQPINYRLTFGINLRELYPPWYIHPSIKNLFYLTQETMKTQRNVNFNMEDILRNKFAIRNTIEEQKLLKRQLIKGKNVLENETSLTALIWILRNFLGLLPTPIFPPQKDGHDWLNFSRKYYNEFLETVRKGYCSILLQEIVVNELMNLPAHNLTFLIEFFDMLNNLARTAQNDEIDQHIVIVLARYYTQCLFIRPLSSRNSINLSREYIGFILFIIFFWRDLQSNLINKIFELSNKKPSMLHYSRELYNEDLYAESSRYLTDKPTQTENVDFGIDDVYDSAETNTNYTANTYSTDYENTCSMDTDSNTTNQDVKSIILDTNNSVINYSNWKDFDYTTAIDSDSKDIYSSCIVLNPVVPSNNIKSTFNTKHISEEYLPEKTDNNKEQHTKKDYKIITSTPCKIDDKDSIFDQIQPDKIDNYFESIKKKNCSFRRTSYTQTTPENIGYSETLNIPKSLKKYRKRKLKKSKIIVMKINYCQHDRNVRVKETKKFKHNKIVDFKENSNSEQLDNSFKIARPNLFENSMYSSTKNEDEYMFDPFIGKMHESCISDSKIGNRNPFVADSVDPSPSTRSNVYNRIVKYGWSYNSNDSPEKNYNLTSQLHLPCQLCYGNDLSIKNNSVVKKTNIVDSLKKVGSKIGFLKKITPSKWNLRKSVSHESLLQERQGIRHGKNYNTI